MAKRSYSKRKDNRDYGRFRGTFIDEDIIDDEPKTFPIAVEDVGELSEIEPKFAAAAIAASG